MIATNIESLLADRVAQQQEQRDREWKQFVIQLDTESSAPDPDHVLSKLTQLNRTPAELGSALERLHRRQWLAKSLAELPALKAELAKHSQSLIAEREAFALIEVSHKSALQNLEGLESQAQFEIRTAQGAEFELRNECSSELKTRLQAAVDMRDRLTDQEQSLRIALHDCEDRLPSASEADSPLLEKRYAALKLEYPDVVRRLADAGALVDRLKTEALSVEAF